MSPRRIVYATQSAGTTPHVAWTTGTGVAVGFNTDVGVGGTFVGVAVVVGSGTVGGTLVGAAAIDTGVLVARGIGRRACRPSVNANRNPMVTVKMTPTASMR